MVEGGGLSLQPVNRYTGEPRPHLLPCCPPLLPMKCSMQTKTCSLWLTLAFVACRSIPASLQLAAQETAPESTTKAEARQAMELATAEVVQWKFRSIGLRETELELVQSPLMRWSNPAVGRVYGSVYLLTDENRPQAIICPYKWFSPYTGFEMECRSLSAIGVKGVRGGKTVWSTTRPGIEWQLVPSYPPVGQTATERQRQLKTIAQEFTAELLDIRTNQDGEDQRLRQLTQPVFRYECLSQNVLEGGVVAFVVGTDPELLLLIEAIESEGDRFWQYALARMNSDRLAVHHREKEVWRVERLTQEKMRDQKEPYFIFEISQK